MKKRLFRLAGRKEQRGFFAFLCVWSVCERRKESRATHAYVQRFAKSWLQNLLTHLAILSPTALLTVCFC